MHEDKTKRLTNGANKATKEHNKKNNTEKVEQQQQEIQNDDIPTICTTSSSSGNKTPATNAEAKEEIASKETETENITTPKIITPPIIQLTAASPEQPEELEHDENANNKNTASIDVLEEIVEKLEITKPTLVSQLLAASLKLPVKTTPAVPAAPTGAPMNYCARRTWITTDRMNELRRKAMDAGKQNKIFTIRGCFNSVRNALLARGWVEKLDMHRKVIPSGQMTYEDLTQRLPKRKAGETRRQYILKCERNIMSRFLEHMPVDFLWTNRKEKCDFIDQAKNPGMTINKFHRAPFTSKEGLCAQLRDFHWFFEEGTAEMYFPRCYNVWSPEELGEFIDNFKMTACVAFLRALLHKNETQGTDTVFAVTGKIPYSIVDFAYRRCMDFIDSCQHNDIDLEDPPKIWEHDWDAFLYQHQQFVQEDMRIQHDGQRGLECMLKSVGALIDKMKLYWPQYTLDGFQNLWIVKPANKCRGRGIILMDSLKKILGVVNPSIASKSRYVVQKYIERPLILFQTKFDIRQWFLITNTQPLVVWMYRESYLRFSSQEYSLSNHHESVHLTNYAIQKKYTNGKRDKRLPSENMWDCYSFQAYLRQIGKQSMWLERIYPGMRKAIVGTMLASQDNMDRRPNTFELFGADFMICENFYPWLIEINSSPDLGATTSVTARMCPQCLEDVVKVVIDRRIDPKSELGNFELVYRQVVPPTPAYMGLNLFVKGKQLLTKVNHGHNYYYQRKERTLQTSSVFRQRSALIPTSISRIHRAMPTFNATEFMEKYMVEPLNSSRSSNSATGSTLGLGNQTTPSPFNSLSSARQKTNSAAIQLAAPAASPCPYLFKQAHVYDGRRRSITQLLSASSKRNSSGTHTESTTTNTGSNTVPPKRQRSCGPRLNSMNREGSEKKFKIMIKTFTRNVGTEVPSASKSENNLLDLYENSKRRKKPSDVSHHSNNEALVPATAPPVTERKWRSLRNVNPGKHKSLAAPVTTTVSSSSSSSTTTTTTTTASISTTTSNTTIPRRINRTKSEIESTASIHAIGRNFGRRCHVSSRCHITTSLSAQSLNSKQCSTTTIGVAQVISPRGCNGGSIIHRSTTAVPVPAVNSAPLNVAPQLAS